MKKICSILFVIVVLCISFFACTSQKEDSFGQKEAEVFLNAYFSMEIPGVRDSIIPESNLDKNSELSISMPEFYTNNFTSEGQNQMLKYRYTDSIYEIAKQNDCKYKCQKVALETEQTESPITYHFVVTLDDMNGNSYECKGDIQLVYENDIWLIDGFYPIFKTLY